MSLFYFAILGLIANSMSTLNWNVCLAKIVRFFFFLMKSLLLGPCKALLKLSWYTYVLYICVYIYMYVYTFFPAQLRLYVPPALENCFLKSQDTSFRQKLFLLGVMNKSPRNRTTWIADAPKQVFCCTLQGLLCFVKMDVAEHVHTLWLDMQILMFSCLSHLRLSDLQA